ncbi:hypothetical protein D9V86_09605 [Bacteroidetes/Chlorobi group bacterium ChocPot_Mid]|nr:MAG: hypothetical protein D9V86_09605 [Bacteroidetes/Chlorobi group bacterium ChocPot_Mid]
MKKFILFILVFVTIQSFLTTNSYAFSGLGSGTSGDPYQITNVNQLQEMKDDLDAYYVLMNDIDASVTSTWNNGQGFVPIGYPFDGTFDGQGHKITGLFIYRPFNFGLFSGTGSGAIVKNVGVVDVKISGSGYPGGSNFIGGLVGGNNGTITNCYVTGNVKGDLRIGGLVGWNAGNGNISNSYSTASVTGIYHIGGLVGCNANGGTISNSYSTGRVSGSLI